MKGTKNIPLKFVFINPNNRDVSIELGRLFGREITKNIPKKIYKN